MTFVRRLLKNKILLQCFTEITEISVGNEKRDGIRQSNKMKQRNPQCDVSSLDYKL